MIPFEEREQLHKIISKKCGSIVAELLVHVYFLLKKEGPIEIFDNGCFANCNIHGYGCLGECKCMRKYQNMGQHNILPCTNIHWTLFPFSGNTTRCHVVHYGPIKLSTSFQEKAVELLKQHKHLFNQMNKHGYTALAAACKGGHLDIVKFLLKCKVDVNFENATGSTALRWAVLKRRVEIVTLLLSAGAKLNVKSGYRVIVRYEENKKNGKLIKYFVPTRQLVDLLIEKYITELSLNASTDSFIIWDKLGRPTRTITRHSSYVYVERQRCPHQTTEVIKQDIGKYYGHISYCHEYPKCVDTKYPNMTIIEHKILPDPPFENFSWLCKHFYEFNGKLYINANIDSAEENDRLNRTKLSQCLEISNMINLPQKIFEICSGLQTLQIPTLILMEIVYEAIPNTTILYTEYTPGMQKLWNIIATIRHFKERDLQIKERDLQNLP